MLRVALIVFFISFAHNAYANVSLSLVKAVHKAYLDQKRVLFYIGKHKQSDEIVMWGQTNLTEDMVQILLENPRARQEMEDLLRSHGNRWSGHYRAYSLYDFLLSDPEQTDRIFGKVVKGSSELHRLNGYVDRIEEVDGVTKFLDNKGNEVLPELNGGATECAMAEGGDACYRLYQNFLEISGKLGQDIRTPQEKVIAYFEENMSMLNGGGIFIKEMAGKLGLNSRQLRTARSNLKKKFSKDHFIHKIVSKQEVDNGKMTTVYRFADTLTPREKRVLDYFEDNMQLLEENGIVAKEMTDELELKSRQLMAAISNLKKKFSKDHFIHKIVATLKRYNGKRATFYSFADAVDTLSPREEKVITYFEENMSMLNGGGIFMKEMADELELNSRQLGGANVSLKKKLPEEHFIHKIDSERETVDGKSNTVYRFADAAGTRALKVMEIVDYFEKNISLLEGSGIVVKEMADELGLTPLQLGYVIGSLKKKLPEKHSIHKIVSKQEVDNSKMTTVYRFDDTLLPREEKVIAYFEENVQLLEGNSINLKEMAGKLGLIPNVLGKVISRLKKKLPEEHFIHKIDAKIRRVDSKSNAVYRFADAVDTLSPREEKVITYFAKNKPLLEVNGIIVKDMSRKLELIPKQLGWVISSLKKKLPEEHFIHKIETKRRSVGGKENTVYRFVDAVGTYTLSPRGSELVDYFEKNISLLEGSGIVVKEIADELGLTSPQLSKAMGSLRKNLPEEHFIHKIDSEQETVDGKINTVYRFADAVGTRALKVMEIVDYFEKNISLLEGSGIVIKEMADELGLIPKQLGYVIGSLKKKLSEEHFIHKIDSEQETVDGKKSNTVYRFVDAVGTYILSPRGREIVDYFEKNISLLEGSGIFIKEIADELGLTSSQLGHVIVSLKKKLPEEHFIHKIDSEKETVDGKINTVYRFVDAVGTYTLSPRGSELVDYFEKNISLLEGSGIFIKEIADELGLTSSQLGNVIVSLKKKLPEEHFIHKIDSERETVDGKSNTVYRFADAAGTRALKVMEIVDYFEKNISLLEGSGIVVKEMADELGLIHRQLGYVIGSLKKKLPEKHFIHKIDIKRGNVDGKSISIYRFANTLLPREEKIIAYFAENKPRLKESGVAVKEIADELGLTSIQLGWVIRSLKKKLPEEHFIHKIDAKQIWVAGKSKVVYHIDNNATESFIVE